uniref:Vacuolar sorting protein 37 n=1 Tax=Mastigamoeba balamuthi TaxID=108607 RepID=E9JPZ6_MASBA|nr:vacuolar sorting protein 37 [Mastigamoeba balamuthi]
MSPPGVGPVPSPLPQQQVAPSGSPYPPPSNLPGGPGYQQGQQQARPVAAFNPLSIPLTQLDTMTLEQLNELLANESKLDDFISQLPAVVELNKLRADLQESNLAQAKKNEAAAAELGKLQAEYETRRAAAEAARAQYDEKAKQQAQALEAFSPQALAARLDALARESDAASEAASQKFLSGEMPLAEFQRVYRDLRVEYHTRCAKREALLHPR